MRTGRRGKPLLDCLAVIRHAAFTILYWIFNLIEFSSWLGSLGAIQWTQSGMRGSVRMCLVDLQADMVREEVLEGGQMMGLID